MRSRTMKTRMSFLDTVAVERTWVLLVGSTWRYERPTLPTEFGIIKIPVESNIIDNCFEYDIHRAVHRNIFL